MLPAKASPIARITVALVGRLTTVVTRATVTMEPITLKRPSIALPTSASCGAENSAECLADCSNYARSLRTRQYRRHHCHTDNSDQDARDSLCVRHGYAPGADGLRAMRMRCTNGTTRKENRMPRMKPL